MNILPILQNCHLFKNKSLEEIDYLLSKTPYKIDAFKENEAVLSPIQYADKIGILLSGSVDVQKLFPAGKIVIIERKKSPDIIGQTSIFSQLTYCPDNIAVFKPCEILFIQQNNLLKLFELDRSIMLNFLESVSDEGILLKHKIGILSLDSIQEKIAGYLFYCKKQQNKKKGDTITLPFSKKAWAEYMDVSRTSLSRELRKLETEGIIAFHKRTIEIVDMARLERILIQ